MKEKKYVSKAQENQKKVKIILQVLEEKNRIQECSEVSVGDIITFFSAEEKKLISAEVVGLPLDLKKNIIVYRPFERKSVGTLRLDKVFVYKQQSHPQLQAAAAVAAKAASAENEIAENDLAENDITDIKIIPELEIIKNKK